MAGSGYKNWAVGEELTSAAFQSYVQDQVVQVYADSSARSTALGTAVSAGMVSFLTSTGSFEVYSGGAWAAVGGGSNGFHPFLLMGA
jgi:hypothetical protein